MMLTTEDATNREEGGGYKFDPAHPDFYRCPVSTPANNHKRPLDDYDPITETIAPSLQTDRKSVIGFSRLSVSRNRSRDIQKPMRKNVEYYFVDKNLQRKESNEMNGYWLQSLCAQPVTEILGKYRRKSDFQRTRYLWSKMFSTPGERALLQAWTNNTTSSQRPTTTAMTTSTEQRKHLTLSNDMKLYSAKSAGSRRCDTELGHDDSRPMLTSASGNTFQRTDSHLDSYSVSRQSPVVRGGDTSGMEDDSQVCKIVLSDKEALPNLNGQRRKGQIVLQQRKYFSGNRKHPAIPHVQRLNPVKVEDIAQSADVICLKPTQKQSTPRVKSREAPVSRERPGSAYSTSDVDKVQVKFPLIVSTKQGTDNPGVEGE